MNDLIRQYPTLEKLVGSADYCECEDCRSVVSPSAYLVDLLQSLEAYGQPVGSSWNDFFDAWLIRYNAEYPFEGPKAAAPWPAGNSRIRKTPYQILLAHRPDIPYLPLTCENTNTVLPYIDIVNEILEYNVVHGGVPITDPLDEGFNAGDATSYARYNSGDASTASLLAEPQNTYPDAYDKLRNESYYPLNLPFDLWLETVRAMFNQMETPLWKALNILNGERSNNSSPTGIVQSLLDGLGRVTGSQVVATSNIASLPVNSAKVRFTGRIRVAAPGAYTFVSTLGATGARSRFFITTLQAPALIDHTAPSANHKTNVTVNLNPGTWYDFIFEGFTLNTAGASLTYSTATVAEGPLSRLNLRTPVAGMTEVLIEMIGMNPKEYDLFTNEDLLTNSWYLLYGYKTPPSNAAELQQAKTLARKLGVTYKELVAIVKTRFVNPGLETLGILWRFKIDPTEVMAYLQWRATLSPTDPARHLLDDKLDALDVAYQPWFTAHSTNVRNELQRLLTNNSFSGALVLRDHTVTGTIARSDFSTTFLEYADSTPTANHPAGPNEFVRINLFVRLWKKLGWTIDEVDWAVCGLWPSDPASIVLSNTITPGSVARGFKTVLFYIAHLSELGNKFNLGKDRIQKLLTLWADIPVHGNNPLYAKLFLAPNLVKRFLNADAVFDDPFGQYLDPPTSTISAQSTILQGAFGVSSTDLGQILTDAALNDDLTISNLSVIYRYALLSRALNISITDLITLKSISGIDPFVPLQARTIASFDEDIPLKNTLEFIRLATLVGGSGLNISDLDYLVRNRFDPLGKYRTTPGYQSDIVRSVGLALRGLNDTSNTAVTEDNLKETLSILMNPQKAVDLISFLKGQEINTTQSAGVVLEANQIDPSLFKDISQLGVSYDRVNQRQRLSWRGVMTIPTRDLIKQRLTGGMATLTTMVDELQRQTFNSFDSWFADLAQLFRYESVVTDVIPAERLDSDTIPPLFSGEYKIQVSYDADRFTQRIVYSGFLTDADKTRMLTFANATQGPVLIPLLDDIYSRGKKDGEALLAAMVDTLLNTFEFETSLATVPAKKIDHSKLVNEPNIRAVYDEVNEVQYVYYRGILKNADKTRINPGSADPLKTLLNKIQALDVQFLADVPVELTNSNPFLSFLKTSPDLNKFNSPVTALNDLSKAVLPVAQRSELRKSVSQILSSGLNVPDTLASLFLTDGRLLAGSDHSSVLESLMKLTVTGVDLQLSNAGGAILQSAIISEVDSKGTPKPAATDTTRFEGYFEVPEDGAFRFVVSLNKNNAVAKFSISNIPGAIIDYTATSNNAESSGIVDLKAGVPYRFVFEATKVGTTDVKVEIVGTNLPRGPLSRLTLQPATSIDEITKQLLLISKSVQVVSSLNLSEREATHILTHKSSFGGVDLGLLGWRDSTQLLLDKVARFLVNNPTSTAAAALASIRASNPDLADETDQVPLVFGGLIRLMEYADLKHELSQGTDDLINVIANSTNTYVGTATDDEALALHLTPLANLTQRDVDTVRDVATRLEFNISFVTTGGNRTITVQQLNNDVGVKWIWRCLQLAAKLGSAIDALFKVPKIVDPESEGLDIAEGLRNALKGRYETEAWHRIIKPISDNLRKMKRDALVASIMDTQGFTSRQQLFEAFLIDPGMEPVVQTSRIQLAIASVQTFIQRCLLGLEVWVHPSVIDGGRWKYLKRMSLWAANRQIYLFPENLLAPEFRDVKTHLFKDLESSLLQENLTDELAEDAYFSYVKGLEEISKLEMRAMYMEGVNDPNPGTIHLVARTIQQPFKYFYRVCVPTEHSDVGRWMPWEPVTAEIQGNHIALIVWQQRPHLFWANIMDKAEAKEPKPEATGNDYATAKISSTTSRFVEVHLYWSEYFQNSWLEPETAGTKPEQVLTVDIPADYNPRDIFINATKKLDPTTRIDKEVMINLSFPPDSSVGSFVLVNKRAAPITKMTTKRALESPYSGSRWESLFSLHNKLDVVTGKQYTWNDQWLVTGHSEVNILATAPDQFWLLLCGLAGEGTPPQGTPTTSITPPAFPTAEQYEAPFFYQDNENTFFVQPSAVDVTVSYWDKMYQSGFVKIPDITLTPAFRLPWDDVTEVIAQSGFTDPVPPDLRSLNERVAKVYDDLDRVVVMIDNVAIGETGRVNVRSADVLGNINNMNINRI
ncbi:MAG: neuraminidase-like domain-containing protein [Bacteroidota bacterium]